MEGVIDSDLHGRGFSPKTGYYLACASRCTTRNQATGSNDSACVIASPSLLAANSGVLSRCWTRPPCWPSAARRTSGTVLTDADTLLVPQSPYPGRVHCGFAEAVEQVWPQVRQLLGTPSRTGALWLTGHSLGGAMATLASVRLTHEGYKVRTVYTYGSPRAGDRGFHDSYCLPNYRFVNNNDLVPHLPFRWCYKHVGKLRLVDGDGQFTEEQASWEAKKQSLAGKAKRVQRANRHSTGLLHAFCDFDWLADHHLDKYLDAIRKILPHVPRRSGGTLLISEADFIAAFANQPRVLRELLAFHREAA